MTSFHLADLVTFNEPSRSTDIEQQKYLSDSRPDRVIAASSTISGVSSGSFSFNGDDLVGGESYDANGNTTATGGKTFAYDSENRLKSLNGGAVTLLYDGDGNRVAKTVNGVTTRYLVDDLNPTGYAQVVEESVGGAVQRAYAYGLQRIDVIQLVNNTWMLSFYGYDGFGSVRLLTDASGSVTDTYVYDAFGIGISTSGHTPNNYLFAGEQWDPDLSLYYLRARYYNPLTERFASRDPEDGIATDPATLHKYLYADGDPVNKADPSGRYANAGVLKRPIGGALGEYTGLIMDIAIASVAAVDVVACAVDIQLSVDALKTEGETNVVPDLPRCSAKGKCPPCNPPSGTKCYVKESRHTHHDWDPHYQIWQQGQNPETCNCYWDRKHGNRGVYQFPPLGLYECDFYSSWPDN